MRPFFPPLEFLQSVNLRAALFRALSELKKNGDLGREAILRKTMLDDCKGDKFEELLATFSTIVLRKVVSQRRHGPEMKLALATELAPNEVAMLGPLTLAHMSALNSRTRRGAQIREGYSRFSDLLSAKADALSARARNRKELAEETPHPEKLVQEVKTNWFGSQTWADTLLDGGSPSAADGFLEMPFELARKCARQGNIDVLTKATNTDLLLDLEHRVTCQKARAKRLKEFKASLDRERDANERNEGPQSPANANALTFRDHQSMTVASLSKTVRQATETQDLMHEHQAILTSLEDALAEVKGRRVTANMQPRFPPRRVDDSSHVERPKTTSTLAPITDEERRMLSPSPGITVTSADHEPRQSPEFDTTQTHSDHQHSPDDPKLPAAADIDQPDRLSPDPDGPPLPQNSSQIRPATLVERTRQSMSLLQPQSKAQTRKTSSSRKSSGSRQSYPANPFETPSKQTEPPPEPPSRSGASTPRDKLFSDDADYASVFKSRPRIATSPLFSPAVHVGLDQALSEEDYDDGASELDLAADVSPLGSRAR